MLGKPEVRRAEPLTPTDHVAEMLEVRHGAGSTRGTYNAIYRNGALANLRGHRRWLLAQMRVAPGMSLLDVACGEAGLVHRANEMGVVAFGVDQSDVALRLDTVVFPPSTLAVADGQSLPYPDESFDRVANIGGLEHYADPVRGASEMARVLKPDGLACVLVRNAYGLRTTVLWAWRTGEVYDDGQPLQRYGTRRQWTRVLEAGGLRITRAVGYESRGELPNGRSGLARGIVGMVRHPTRCLVPLDRWMPIDMAAMHVFLCAKA